MSPVVILAVLGVIIFIMIYLFGDKFKGSNSNFTAKTGDASGAKKKEQAALAAQMRELAASINAWR